jgi:hypothetical protein
MSLAKVTTIIESETHLETRRLKVCAVVVKSGQAGLQHDGQAEQTDVARPQPGTRTGRMIHQRILRNLCRSRLDRLTALLPKQKA